MTLTSILCPHCGADNFDVEALSLFKCHSCRKKVIRRAAFRQDPFFNEKLIRPEIEKERLAELPLFKNI